MKSFRRAHLYLALMIPAILIGFWPTYFGILADLPPTITPVLHTHAFLMFLWVAMLVAQPWLVHARKARIHRLVGRASYLLAPLVIWVGLIATHEILLRPPDQTTQVDAANLILGVGQVVAFGAVWSLAIVYRRTRERHARFMVSTAFAVSTAVVFRVFFSWVPGFGTQPAAVHGNFITLSLILLVLIGHDWRLGIRRSPYLVVFSLLGLMYGGYFHFVETGPWLSFTQWFHDLPALIILGA